MISVDYEQVVYNGNGIQNAWPYSFPIYDGDVVRLILLDADGTETDITQDYFVDVPGSTVYYPGYAPGEEPPEADQPPKVQTGQKLIVYRDTEITQDSDLGDSWPFNVIEKGLDKLTMILQEKAFALARCLKISQGQAAEIDDYDTTIPLAADKVICGNANGTGFEAREAMMEVNGAWDGEGRQIHSVADPTANQDAVTKKYADTRMDNNFMKLQADGTGWESRNLPIRNVAGPALVKDAANKDYVDRILAGYSGQGDRFVFFDNVEQMQLAKPVPSQMAVTLGYWDVNDGGAGVYTIRDIGADTPDGGSIIEIPGTDHVAELITDGTVNVKQFGAKADANYLNSADGFWYVDSGYTTRCTDNSTFIQNALDCGASVVVFQQGNYKTGERLYPPSNVTIDGDGSTICKEGLNPYTDNGMAFYIKSVSNVTIKNFYFLASLNSADLSSFARSSNVLWSNVTAISISDSSNVIVDNCIFENVEYAFKIDGIDGTNYHIYLSKIRTIGQVPMPIYCSHTEDFILSDSYLENTSYASVNDHCMYMSCGDNKKHKVTNSTIIENSGGTCIIYRNSDGNTDHGIDWVIVSACHLTSNGWCFAIGNLGNMYVYDSVCVETATTSGASVLRCMNAHLYCEGLNITSALYALNMSGVEVVCKSCEIKAKELVINGYFSAMKADVSFVDCDITLTKDGTQSIYIENNRPTDTTLLHTWNFTRCKFDFPNGGSYAITIRSATIVLNVLYCTFVAASGSGYGLYYNTQDYGEVIRIIKSTLLGYDRILNVGVTRTTTFDDNSIIDTY